MRSSVDDALLDRSVNAALVRAGLAYGEFYTTMPLSLIRHLRDLVGQARAAGAGLWPRENVGVGVPAQPTGVADLSDMVIFPKLYRRLVDYFGDDHGDLTAFDTWVRAVPGRDDPAQLPDGERGHLHDLCQVDDDGIRLRLLPEQVIFLERATGVDCCRRVRAADARASECSGTVVACGSWSSPSRSCPPSTA